MCILCVWQPTSFSVVWSLVKQLASAQMFNMPTRCACVVGVSRNKLGDAHSVPHDLRYNSWEEVAKVPKFADAVIVATPDQLHKVLTGPVKRNAGWPFRR